MRIVDADDERSEADGTERSEVAEGGEPCPASRHGGQAGAPSW